MKKILSLILLCFISFNTVFAYSPTHNEIKIVETLESKIDKIIEKKGEKSRELFIKQFASLKIKKKNDEKLGYILDELIDHLQANISTSEIENILKQVENSQEFYIDETNSAFIIFKEYLNLYNTKIDNVVYGQNGKIKNGCGTFWDKWNDMYKNQIENYYKIATDQNAYFVMDLIKYDINKFEQYFMKECNSTYKLEKIDFHTGDFIDDISVMETSYYAELYIYYNNWYSRIHERLYNTSASGSACNDIWTDWNDFTGKRFDFLENYMNKTGSKNYSKYFQELENNFRELLEDDCNGLKIN